MGTGRAFAMFLLTVKQEFVSTEEITNKLNLKIENKELQSKTAKEHSLNKCSDKIMASFPF